MRRIIRHFCQLVAVGSVVAVVVFLPALVQARTSLSQLQAQINALQAQVDALTDTNAETECPDGHVLLGDGSCVDLQAAVQEQICFGFGLGGLIDNEDGTVSDCGTGLMWEKKNGAGGGQDFTNPHDVDNRYTWSLGSPFDFDGTAKTDFIDTLNTVPCFAGHCDWRLPKVSRDADAGMPELETILLASCPGGGVPCIDPIFGPTATSFYWSATTFAGNPNFAWFVFFNFGDILDAGKLFNVRVRAVRTGP